LVANSFIRRAFSSAVIDIGVSFQSLRVMAQAGMSSSRARGEICKSRCARIGDSFTDGKGKSSRHWQDDADMVGGQRRVAEDLHHQIATNIYIMLICAAVGNGDGAVRI